MPGIFRTRFIGVDFRDMIAMERNDDRFMRVLAGEITERGWSQRELARRAGQCADEARRPNLTSQAPL
jgi:hypothetical protein